MLPPLQKTFSNPLAHIIAEIKVWYGLKMYVVSPAFDPNNGNVYVTNFNSNGSSGNTVSVISTTLKPTQAIQQLINTIDSFHLPKGVTTSLEDPLNAALAQLNRNNDTPACNQLNAFLNQVNAKQSNGQLTPQQAAELTQQAKAIHRSLMASALILQGMRFYVCFDHLTDSQACSYRKIYC
jgi:hypothetical protein